jgi:hypothetical protein
MLGWNRVAVCEVRVEAGTPWSRWTEQPFAVASCAKKVAEGAERKKLSGGICARRLGPGKFDAELFLDGKGLRPDGNTAAVLTKSLELLLVHLRELGSASKRHQYLRGPLASLARGFAINHCHTQPARRFSASRSVMPDPFGGMLPGEAVVRGNRHSSPESN